MIKKVKIPFTNKEYVLAEVERPVVEIENKEETKVEKKGLGKKVVLGAVGLAVGVAAVAKALGKKSSDEDGFEEVVDTESVDDTTETETSADAETESEGFEEV